MATLVLWSVIGAVVALWVWIGVRVVRRPTGPGTATDREVRALAERGVRELQLFLVDR